MTPQFSQESAQEANHSRAAQHRDVRMPLLASVATSRQVITVSSPLCSGGECWVPSSLLEGWIDGWFCGWTEVWMSEG